MLHVSNISNGYEKKQVLFNVSFEVKQGEIVLLAGANGSGKSTILKTISGALPVRDFAAAGSSFSSGSIMFNDENITNCRQSELTYKGLQNIQQKNNCFPDLTVRENLEISGFAIKDRNKLKTKIDKVYEKFPILARQSKRYPEQMSGGERQLLVLAMAFLNKPVMILLDEPLAGLDPKNIALVVGDIRRLNEEEKITFLIVEHRLRDIVSIANRIIGIKQGKVILEKPVKKKFDLEELKNLFI